MDDYLILLIVLGLSIMFFVGCANIFAYLSFKFRKYDRLFSCLGEICMGCFIIFSLISAFSVLRLMFL